MRLRDPVAIVGGLEGLALDDNEFNVEGWIAIC